MAELCFFKNQWLERTKVGISPLDTGFARGYAVNEFIPVFSGKPFRMSDYLHRLQNSCAIAHLQLPFPLNDIASLVYEGVRVNGIEEGYIKIYVIGGQSFDIVPFEDPYLLILAGTPRPKFASPAKVQTVDSLRPFPRCKSTSYFAGIIAQKEVIARGFTDALFIHNGCLLETPTANFFAVKAGVLITPKLLILNGIMRKTVLDLTEEIPTQERAIPLEELTTLDEAFLTSSSRLISPIAQIDHYRFSPAPGPLTSRLMEKVHKYLSSSMVDKITQ